MPGVISGVFNRVDLSLLWELKTGLEMMSYDTNSSISRTQIGFLRGVFFYLHMANRPILLKRQNLSSTVRVCGQ